MDPRQHEVVSALQKYVRRGQEIEALRCFFELEETGLVKVALGRVRVIAHEDVGIGDMIAVTFALRCLDDAEAMMGRHGWRLAATNAVLALCRATKSRVGDHATVVSRGRNCEGQLELLDAAYDKHTYKGKSMGRGLDHFRKEGAQLDRVDRETTPDPYEDEAYRYWADGRIQRLNAKKPSDKPPERQGRMF